MEFVCRYSVRWLIGAIFLMNCCSLFAQVNVAGTVVDPDGSAVPSVEVLLKTSQGSTVEGGSTTADSQGHFHLLHIAPRDYELEIPSKYGFERYQAPIHGSLGMHDLRIQLLAPVFTQDVAVAPETSTRSPPDAQMLEKVPVFDQDYIATLTPFLDQTGVSTMGVSILVDGVEMKGTGVSASALPKRTLTTTPIVRKQTDQGKGASRSSPSRVLQNSTAHSTSPSVIGSLMQRTISLFQSHSSKSVSTQALSRVRLASITRQPFYFPVRDKKTTCNR
jgi:hypothetical protein